VAAINYQITLSSFLQSCKNSSHALSTRSLLSQLGTFKETEVHRVPNNAYSFAYLDNSSAVCETLPKQPFRQTRSLNDCSDDELRYIRTALHRVASLRILNTDDVEDVVQETLLTMTAKYPQERLEKGLLVWSMGILRHKVGNYYRQARRCASFDENATPQWNHHDGAFREMSPESAAQYSELRFLLSAIIAKFQPTERQALNLHMDGIPSGEIAETLHGEKYQNIINKVYRGRNKLAKELVKYGYGNGKTIKKRSR
jgi:RNA polymerase sigma factor (sigma-70 family)